MSSIEARLMRIHWLSSPSLFIKEMHQICYDTAAWLVSLCRLPGRVKLHSELDITTQSLSLHRLATTPGRRLRTRFEVFDIKYELANLYYCRSEIPRPGTLLPQRNPAVTAYSGANDRLYSSYVSLPAYISRTSFDSVFPCLARPKISLSDKASHFYD